MVRAIAMGMAVVMCALGLGKAYAGVVERVPLGAEEQQLLSNQEVQTASEVREVSGGDEGTTVVLVVVVILLVLVAVAASTTYYYY